MATYQTGRLEQYPETLQAIAEQLFNLVKLRVSSQQARKYPGSYSVLGTTTKETAAKIIIYHPEIGKTSKQWPHVRDGIYVLVRANGRLAKNIWGDILDQELPEMFVRFWRNETISIAPKNAEQFSYFPVMAGDSLDQIAMLLDACSRC